MSRNLLSKLVRSSRTIMPSTSRTASTALRASAHRAIAVPLASQVHRAATANSPRFFSTTRPFLKGLSPETDNPQPKQAEPNVTATGPADITIEQFHAVADDYLAALIEKLEQLQEETEEIDVEYSVCFPFLNSLLFCHGNVMIHDGLLANGLSTTRQEFSPLRSPRMAPM